MADGIRIIHESGPLAGKTDTFGADTAQILFGREAIADVRFPSGASAVGGEHFTIERTKTGKYTVSVSPDYHVEIDGKPAKSGMAVKEGMIFRLGRKDGPTFRVHLDGVTRPTGYIPTETQGLFNSTRELVVVHGRRLRTAIVAGSVAVVLLAAGIVLGFLYNEDLRFAWYQDDLMHSAYAVFKVKEKDGRRQSDLQGTAWPIRPGVFATNAHVIGQTLLPGETLVVRAPESTEDEFYPIVRVLAHPQYDDFKEYREERQYGVFTENFRFADYSVVNPFDVALIFAKGADKVEPELTIASPEEIDALEPDTEVLYFGYPLEGDISKLKADERVAPVPIRGRLAQTENMFGIAAGEDERPAIFSVKMDALGGGSGGPVMLSNGHIIGLISTGSVDTMLSRDEHGKTVVKRVASGIGLVMVQRADRVATVEQPSPGPAAEEADWDAAAKGLLSWTGLVGEARSALDATLPEMDACAPGEAIAPAKLKLPKVESGASRHQYQLHVEAGRTYGFLGYADGNAMITLQLSGSDRKRLSKAVEDVKFPQLVYKPAASGDITLTVEGASEVEAEIYQACGGTPTATTTAAGAAGATTPGAD